MEGGLSGEGEERKAQKKKSQNPPDRRSLNQNPRSVRSIYYYH